VLRQGHRPRLIWGDAKIGFQNWPSKLLTEVDIEVKNLDFDQDFSKIGTFPCPKFEIFGKPLGRATFPENFVGQSLKTKKCLKIIRKPHRLIVRKKHWGAKSS